MRACLKESLRLSPVLAGNARQTGRDVVLSGYQVPKGVRSGRILLTFQFYNIFFSTDRSRNGPQCNANRRCLLPEIGRLHTRTLDQK